MLETIHKAIHTALQPPKKVGLSCQVPVFDTDKKPPPPKPLNIGYVKLPDLNPYPTSIWFVYPALKPLPLPSQVITCMLPWKAPLTLGFNLFTAKVLVSILPYSLSTATRSIPMDEVDKT